MADINSILTDLLKNPAAQQFAFAAGKDISAGRPIGEEVGRVGEELLGAKSQFGLNARTMKMLQQILGAGGKVNMQGGPDGAKVSLSGGESMLKALGGGAEDQSIGDPDFGTTGTSTKDVASDQMALLNSFLNPSPSPLGDISISDLAGLTSKDVSQALSGALGVEALRQKRISDVAGLSLTRAKTRLAQAQATKALMIEDKRTTLVKNYEFAQSQGFEGTLSEWKTTETTHKRDYDEAVKGGYTGDFHTWMIEMAKAGAINLGEAVAKKSALEDVEAVKYFTDPKGLTRDIDKFVSSDDVQNQLIQLEGVNVGRKKAQLTETFITGKIASAGGTILESKLDGRTFVWTVQWPDGSTSEVRHAN